MFWIEIALSKPHELRMIAVKGVVCILCIRTFFSALLYQLHFSSQEMASIPNKTNRMNRFMVNWHIYVNRIQYVQMRMILWVHQYMWVYVCVLVHENHVNVYVHGHLYLFVCIWKTIFTLCSVHINRINFVLKNNEYWKNISKINWIYFL